MIYIYDILLNFNNDFIEFYEWEKNDNILHIKKIPVIKVEARVLEEILNKKVQIEDPIVMEILNKTEVFDNKKVKTIKYACILTDTYRTVAILLNDNYVISKVSDLLLDEAYDTIDISKRCNFRDIAYNILGVKRNYTFLTREETKIKKYLTTEIKNAYKEQDKTKLSYLYFEFFDKNSSDIDKIFSDLMLSLSEEVNEKHRRLYELVKLASTK